MLLSVHQNHSFELSKSTIQQFFRFFTLRGYPFDLGGVKFYLHYLKWRKLISFYERPWIFWMKTILGEEKWFCFCQLACHFTIKSCAYVRHRISLPMLIEALGLTIEKDLAGLKAPLTLVECFPVDRRGCGALPEWGLELPPPIRRYPSHES